MKIEEHAVIYALSIKEFNDAIASLLRKDYELHGKMIINDVVRQGSARDRVQTFYYQQMVKYEKEGEADETKG